eukprot:746716-Hanusia_phi.AAC.1
MVQPCNRSGSLFLPYFLQHTLVLSPPPPPPPPPPTYGRGSSRGARLGGSREEEEEEEEEEWAEGNGGEADTILHSQGQQGREILAASEFLASSASPLSPRRDPLDPRICHVR